MRVAAAAVALALAVAPVASASAASVRITDRLEPAAVTVDGGAAVTWQNDDDERHRIRSTSGPEKLDSGNLEPGETWTFTFTLPGDYRYVDARNPDAEPYWGTVTVSGGGSTSPAASDNPSGAEPGGSPRPISMQDRSFSPGSVEVPVGASVSWVNDSDRDHTVTADDGSFDSGTLGPGARYSQTFSAPGRYGYFCALHSGMRGTVVVGDGRGAAGDTGSTAASAGDDGSEHAAGSGSRTQGLASNPATDVVQADARVDVRDFEFDPQTVEVAAGTTVTWHQVGDAPHTVTADDGSFDSGTLEAGATFTHTFDEAGAHPYVCSLHPQMVGEVVVVAAELAEEDVPAPQAARAPEQGRSAGSDGSSGPSGGGGDDGPTTATGAGLPGSPGSAFALAAGLVAVGLLVSGSVLLGTRRIERALRTATPGAPRPAPPPQRRT